MQNWARQFEKVLGLNEGKIAPLILGFSKAVAPLLNKIEAKILKKQKITPDELKKILKIYTQQWSQYSEVGATDFLPLSNEIFKAIKNKIEFQKLLSFFLQWGEMNLFGGTLKNEVDEFGMDPSFVELVRPIFEFLYEDYWRVEVQGIQNIPKKGRCLLVANHSGMLPYDGAMITVACLKKHPARRSVRFLIEDFVYHFPFLGTFMHRIGAVRACPENATWLLKKEELVLVFPEGVKGLGKLYSERYQLKRFGRGGFVRLAIETQTPIVPVAIVGAEEIHPIIWKSSILAKAMGVPYLPVTPTFPWFGPAGLIPLPTKWKIQFGKPFLFNDYKAKDAEDVLLVQTLSEKVQARIQTMVTQSVKKRKSIWMG